MKLSDYCKINRQGTAFIDIDSGWKFHCDLYGMNPEYAQLFIRRLSKKRRLYDFDELLAVEVVVPDEVTQLLIVGAVSTIDKLWMAVGGVMSANREMLQLTSDPYYDEMGRYYSNLLGELNDHRFMLIDQLMGV